MTTQIPRARMMPAFLLIAALAAPMLVAPAGAQPYTGLIYEPWHYRFVGSV